MTNATLDLQPSSSSTETPAPLPAITDHHYWYCVDGKNETIASVKVYERHGVQWMTDVWVDPAYRRKGMATRLIREAIARYGHDDLYLQVHSYHDRPATDEQLVAFYGRFGFALVKDAPGMMRRLGRPLTN